MRNQLYRILAVAVLSASFSLVASAQTVKTTISFPFPTRGIAADPLHNLIYVVAPTNGTTSTDNLAIINGTNDTFVGNVAVPTGAAFVAVDGIANRIFVTGCDTMVDPSPCTVTVIDGYTDKVIRTIDVTSTPGGGLTGVVVNPFDGVAYVANASDNVIDVIYRNKLRIDLTIDLKSNSPAAIAIDPFLNRLYVPYGTNETAVIDALRKRILKTITFGSEAVGAAADVLSGNIFVTDAGLNEVGVIDRNGTVLASAPANYGPLGVDVDPITNRIFVADQLNGRVTVINGATKTVSATLTGIPATYVSVNLFSTKVYVSGISGVTVLAEK